MIRVGEFEKVSYKQFHAAMIDEFGKEVTDIHLDIQEIYDKIELPTRATSGSAGYDFKAPFIIAIPPKGNIKIPTGIRVKIEEGWWLGCLPRSGLGFKFRLQLDNTLGVIDSDYSYSDNEGHIFVKLTNDTNKGKTLTISAGDGFMQAIFLPYGITHSDNAQTVRNGGMGSTGA